MRGFDIDHLSYELGVMLYNAYNDKVHPNYDIRENFYCIFISIPAVNKGHMIYGFVSEAENNEINSSEAKTMFQRAFSEIVEQREE